MDEMEYNDSEYLFIDGFRISEIIFDDKDSDVTMVGSFMPDGAEEPKHCTFISDFSNLTNLLTRIGTAADPIISRLTDLLSADFVDSPTIVEIEPLIGDELVVDQWVLQVDLPKFEDDEGNWVEDPNESCYYVVDIISREDFLKQQSLEIELVAYQTMLSMCYDDLEKLYKDYLMLVKEGKDETEARKQCNLENDLLFQIAYLNYSIENLDLE